MNPENLVPNYMRTPTERRENARKAGKASGRARRWKSDIGKCMREMLGEDATMEEFCKAMYEAVVEEHSVEAAKFFRDTMGQSPLTKTQTQLTGSDGGPVQTEIVMNFVRSNVSDGASEE